MITRAGHESGLPSRPRSEALLVCGAAVLAMLHALRAFQAAISDDAFILYRYADHLCLGEGLVWNVGEPPIEGFTSLLHVVALAAGRLVGLDFVLLGQLLGIGFAGLACVAAARLGREAGGGDPRVAVAAAFLTALSPSLAAWARGGMETTVFTALLAFAMAAWLRESRCGSGRIGASVLFFGATLSRPEALGIALITIAVDLLGTSETDPERSAYRRIVAWWPLGLALVVLVVWKAFYFGTPIPNTYHAKTGGGLAAFEAGARYVGGFFKSFGVVGLALAIIPPLFPRDPSSWKRFYVLLCLAAYSLHVARVGGDYQYFARYMVPVLPMLCVLTAHGATRGWDAMRNVASLWRGAAAAAVLAAVAVPLSLPSIREIRDRPWLLVRPVGLVDDTDPEHFSHDFEKMGKALHEVALPDEKIAAVAVGAIGYYSKRPVLDLLGLNDSRIARLPVRSEGRPWVSGHMRGSADEVMRRRPRLIVLPVRPTTSPDPIPSTAEREAYPFIDDLLESSEFQASYEPESHPLPDGRWLNLYRLRDSTDPGRQPS